MRTQDLDTGPRTMTPAEGNMIEAEGPDQHGDGDAPGVSAAEYRPGAY